MFDFHSHILPNVPGDDGARSFDMARNMARQSADAGFTNVLATSHFVPGEPFGKRSELLNMARAFMNVINKNEKLINIVPAHEVYLTPEIMTYIRNSDILLISNKAVLIELPMTEWLKETLRLITEIQDLGIRVIVAHPERCAAVAEDPECAIDLIDCGAFLQLNLASLRNPKSKTGRAARALLKYQAYHFVGTDAHNHSSRSPLMQHELELLKLLTTPEYFELITKTNPDNAFRGFGFYNHFNDKMADFKDFNAPQAFKDTFWRRLEAWRFGKKKA